jgi:hypothetical protein
MSVPHAGNAGYSKAHDEIDHGKAHHSSEKLADLNTSPSDVAHATGDSQLRARPEVTAAATQQSADDREDRSARTARTEAPPAGEPRTGSARASDQGTDGYGFDATSTARQAQKIVHNELDISQELSQLKDGEVRSAIKVRTDHAISEFDVVIELGDEASPSQILVTILLYADSENQVQASQDDASDSDKEILQAIQENSLRPEYHSGQHSLAWARSKNGQQALK